MSYNSCNVFSSPAIGSDGTVYIGTWFTSGKDFGYLYAFGETDKPESLIVSGPVTGKIGKECEYTFMSIGHQNDDVFYFIEWGNGDDIEWIGQGKRTESCFSIVFLCSWFVF